MRIRYSVSALLVCLLFSFTLQAQQTTGLPKAILFDKSGRQVPTSSISDFDNPIIVMTYSEKWCSSCVEMVSRFDRNYDAYGKRSSVKLIAVNLDQSSSGSEVFSNAGRWRNIEVLHDRNGEYQKAMFTTSAPRIIYLDDHQQAVFSENTFNIDVVKAYKLADNIKKNLVKAEKVFFDSAWFPVPEAEALYYRQIRKTSDGKWDVIDYYKNGTVQMKGQALIVYPLVRTGLFQYFYNTGKKQSETVYVNDKATGKSTGWYPDGSIRYEYNFTDNRYDGKWSYYHPNGKLANIGLYSEGKAIGTWYHYYPSGKKMKETNWQNGKREGRCIGWFEQGLVKYEVVFSNDKLNYSPAPKYIYASGKPVITIKETSTGTIKNLYRETGELFLTAETSGTITDIVMYYENGKQILKTTMSDEKTVNGKLILYYENGNKQLESTIYNNKPSGKAMSWYDDGSVFEKVDFKLNSWEYFDKKGNRISKPENTFINVNADMEIDTKSITDELMWVELSIKQDGTIAGMN